MYKIAVSIKGHKRGLKYVNAMDYNPYEHTIVDNQYNKDAIPKCNDAGKCRRILNNRFTTPVLSFQDRYIVAIDELYYVDRYLHVYTIDHQIIDDRHLEVLTIPPAKQYTLLPSAPTFSALFTASMYILGYYYMKSVLHEKEENQVLMTRKELFAKSVQLSKGWTLNAINHLLQVQILEEESTGGTENLLKIPKERN